MYKKLLLTGLVAATLVGCSGGNGNTQPTPTTDTSVQAPAQANDNTGTPDQTSIANTGTPDMSTAPANAPVDQSNMQVTQPAMPATGMDQGQAMQAEPTQTPDATMMQQPAPAMDNSTAPATGTTN